MISWFLPSILKHRRLFAQVFLAGLTLKLLALVTPFVFQAVIDRVLVTRGLSTLDVLFAALLLAAIIDALLGGARSYLSAHTINRISADLSSKLYEHLFALPLGYFQRWRIGEIISRTRELGTIRGFITSTAMSTLMDLIFIFIFPAVLLLISPTLSLIVFLSIPLQVAVYFGFGPFMRARNQEQFLAGAQYQSRMVEALAGIETVKSLNVEPKIRQALEKDLASSLYTGFRSRKLGIISGEMTGIIGRITQATILFFGARFVIDGHMTLGELIAFNMISGYVSGPMMRLAELWEDWQQIRVSFARFGDILNEPTETSSLIGIAHRPPIRGDIQVEAISFRYFPEVPLVLDGVSLRIEAGQVVGIVGSSGSGKSTLVKVLSRLLVPQSGRVLIDGVDTAKIDPNWLRSQITYVPQDTMIFNGTVAVNLALARPEVSTEQMYRAAELACAHDFIMRLPQGYETPLGERGVNLSGGQRQRLAIARAIIADPKVLVLDEATSALDVESEHVILDHLREIGVGRTMIVVSHRLSMMLRTDTIFALEVGQIAEQGSHAVLCAQNGRYAGLLRLQGATAHAE